MRSESVISATGVTAPRHEAGVPSSLPARPVRSQAASIPRITRPFAVRLSWVLRTHVPTAIFLAAVVVSVLLWRRHTTQMLVPGEVESTQGGLVTYIQREARIRPVVGMPVRISLCSQPGKLYDSQVQSIGTKVLTIPEHLVAGTGSKWGLQVKIAIPPGIDLRAGDQVNVYWETTR